MFNKGCVMQTLNVMQVQLFFFTLNTLKKASVCTVLKFWSLYKKFDRLDA